ncbi:MAG: recombination regulator RecX [Sutterellaceae bacterium]|nr:recombination regulator RecX [Burkholderiaceae bacterium]MCX7901291.1 recombination regulator RecX [Burkholderiaceae bacterium]MDW8429179.1 recombination regulator RecX [Sutterellaceae bacterium]
MRTLRQQALAALARREHSRVELARKLKRTGAPLPEAELARLLDELTRDGLLSDARFAEALVRARAPRYGAARIAQEMRERGVPDALIRAAVAALNASEEARARAVWQKRFGAPAACAAERARQARFLQQRGFSAAVIRRILGGIEE